MKASAKPLAGMCIVLTRAPEQAGELARRLLSAGGEVILLPAVAFAPPEDWSALDAALRALDTFDAILFLSQNAVRYVFERIRELGIGRQAMAPRRRLIAAVGPATAEAAAREGLQVDYVAKNRTGESLARELRDLLAGRSVFLPRSDRGDARVPDALREAGARVAEAIAYRTLAPESFDPAVLGRIQRAAVDAVVFASPSAWRNLAHQMGAAELAGVSARVPFAAIGPTTAQALREAGARVEIEAGEGSAVSEAGLADAILQYFRRRQGGWRKQA